MTDIRDIRGPVEFPAGPFFYILLAILVLALIAALTMFLLRRRKKASKKAPPPKLPHEIAYEELESLRKKGLIESGRVKEYYFELSLIARRYLENRFDLRAPEMTTEEFLGKLKDSDALSREHKNLLKDFLSHCDMVKFAKYGPSREEMTLSFDSARRLVDETREVNRLAGEPVSRLTETKSGIS